MFDKVNSDESNLCRSVFGIFRPFKPMITPAAENSGSLSAGDCEGLPEEYERTHELALEYMKKYGFEKSPEMNTVRNDYIYAAIEGMLARRHLFNLADIEANVPRIVDAKNPTDCYEKLLQEALADYRARGAPTALKP